MSDYSRSYDGAAKDLAQSVLAGADFDSEFDLIQTAVNSKQDISTLVAAIKAEMLISMYPVGSIYMSTQNVSPQTFLGGTWASIQGVVLFAEDGTSGYVAGNTGGSKDVTKVYPHTHSVTGTAASAGSHTHAIAYGTNASVGVGTYLLGRNQTIGNVNTASNGAHTHTVSGTAASTGTAGANDNMPPYLAVYVWKRTA